MEHVIAEREFLVRHKFYERHLGLWKVGISSKRMTAWISKRCYADEKTKNKKIKYRNIKILN